MMMESKILDEDKDEWIYSSMKRYTNLYMFELEFPVNALEVIGEMSICVSGLQAYSKKCEILQLSIPPKLFPKDVEEGLCKDRDFQIVSGGYASSKILQIKPIRSSDSVVACTQSGENGVTIFQLGNENCAIVKEVSKLSAAEYPTTNPGFIDTFSNRIVLGSTDGKHLYEWNLDNPTVSTYPINSNSESITKLKFWDENTLTYLTDQGVVYFRDLRSLENTAVLYSSKNLIQSDSSSSSSALGDPAVAQGQDLANLKEQPSGSASTSKPPPPIVFSFDSIPSKQQIGIIDSYGGYEVFDLRLMNVKSHSIPINPNSRALLPGFLSSSCGVVRERFNIEFSNVGASMNEFIVTGLREEVVHVVGEKWNLNQKSDNLDNSGSLESFDNLEQIFVHDGHSKTVSHALWHPHLPRLVFSASVDSWLHAWQFDPNYKINSE